MEFTLQLGDQGEWVSWVQQTLYDQGIDPGPVDGDLGEHTDRAVREFQERQGLVVDGVIGPWTWSALGVEEQHEPEPASTGMYDVLAAGATGEWVSYLQDCLGRVGLYTGAQDGVFGETTAAAVVEYQIARQLGATRTVDDNMWLPLVADVQAGTTFAARQPAQHAQHVEPDRETQLPSWVEPHHPPGGTPDSAHQPVPPKVLIGQIFFVTDGNTLDPHDQAELTKIFGAYAPELSTHKVDFEFHGFADRRHTSAHNSQLAQERADMVMGFVRDGFAGHSNFRAVAVSHGIDPDPQYGDTAADLARFRRVDIHAVPAREFGTSPPVTPPKVLRSTEFRVQLKGSAGVSPPLPVKAGPMLEDARLEIHDVTNKLGIVLLYKGFGVGIGTSTFSLSDSDFVPVTTSKPVALEDFIGKGHHQAALAALGAGVGFDRFEFDGPMVNRGASATPAEFRASASIAWQAGIAEGGSSGEFTAVSGVFEL